MVPGTWSGMEDGGRPCGRLCSQDMPRVRGTSWDENCSPCVGDTWKMLPQCRRVEVGTNREWLIRCHRKVRCWLLPQLCQLPTGIRSRPAHGHARIQFHLLAPSPLDDG